MTTILRKRATGEKKIIPNGAPEIVFEGRIGAIVQYPVLEDQGQGYVEKKFEKFVRSPGTRIVALKDNKIYLQKEARIETGDFDWRLPGGKVVDTFAEFKKYLTMAIPEDIILRAALKELQEEAGLIGEASMFAKKVCGATVEWDLYYVMVTNVQAVKLDHAHQEGEEVSESKWCTFAEIEKMCETGAIGEGRSVAALVEFMANMK